MDSNSVARQVYSQIFQHSILFYTRQMFPIMKASLSKPATWVCQFAVLSQDGDKNMRDKLYSYNTQVQNYNLKKFTSKTYDDISTV